MGIKRNKEEKYIRLMYTDLGLIGLMFFDHHGLPTANSLKAACSKVANPVNFG